MYRHGRNRWRKGPLITGVKPSLTFSQKRLTAIIFSSRSPRAERISKRGIEQTRPRRIPIHEIDTREESICSIGSASSSSEEVTEHCPPESLSDSPSLDGSLIPGNVDHRSFAIRMPIMPIRFVHRIGMDEVWWSAAGGPLSRLKKKALDYF